MGLYVTLKSLCDILTKYAHARNDQNLASISG